MCIFHLYVCALNTLVEIKVQWHAYCEICNVLWVQGKAVLV